MEGAAGTAMVTDAVLLVSATEVAVTVTLSEDAEAAGAVNVAPVVVVFDSVPPPLMVHVTPSAPLSFTTVAVIVAVSVGSTVDADDVTVMLTGLELPPQPAKKPAMRRQESVKAATLNVRVNDPVIMPAISSDHNLARRGKSEKSIGNKWPKYTARRCDCQFMRYGIE
jgi:hypothetical protein